MTTPTGGGNTYSNFFDSVLTNLGAPITQQNLDALASVTHLEGLNSRDNPLNSVIQSGNSTAFNSVGVQDYNTAANGVAGTTALLKGPVWSGVLTQLKAGNNEQGVLAEFAKVYDGWDPGTTSATFTTDQNTVNQILNGNVDTGVKGTSTLPPVTVGTVSGGGIIGSVVGGVQGTVEGGEQVIADATSPLEFMKALFADLTSASTWIRIGMVLLGFVIVLIALDRLSQGAISGAMSSKPEAEAAPEAAPAMPEAPVQTAPSTPPAGGQSGQVKRAAAKAPATNAAPAKQPSKVKTAAEAAAVA